METKVKLTAKKIMKSLPKGFIGVSLSKKSPDVWIKASLQDISLEDASKAISKFCKENGLTIEQHSSDGCEADWKLYDKAFNKQMVVDAKECLKAVKHFFTKYQMSFVYSDSACNVVRQIKQLVNNEQVYAMKRNVLIKKLKEVCKLSYNEKILVIPVKKIRLLKGLVLNKFVNINSEYHECYGTVLYTCNIISINTDTDNLMLDNNAIRYSNSDNYHFDFIELRECPLDILRQVIQNIPSRPDLKIWYDLNECI